MTITRMSLLVFVLLRVSALAQTALPNPPDAPKRRVTDQYHGIKITDDYRWLENWDDPAVKQWSAGENQRTREYLDHPSKNS
jgi:prolyl oligopeptidase